MHAANEVAVTAPVGAPTRSSSEAQPEAGARPLSVLGRIGLAGRTGFYLVLTCITARIAAMGGAAHQADAEGALAIVTRQAVGKVAVAVVAAGFVLFGVGRLVGAWRDRAVGGGRRAMTVLQGLFYLAVAEVPVSYLAGDHATGSQQQQRKTTAQLLGLPGGRFIVAGVGVVFICVCVQQIRGALNRSFTDGLALEGAGRAVKATAHAAGAVGITARALVFLPVGLFLVVAGVEADPRRSVGTDGELLQLAGHWWGDVLVAGVAIGLAVFCCYSAIETRYRRVVSAR